jgi:hypothetical protein
MSYAQLYCSISGALSRFKTVSKEAMRSSWERHHHPPTMTRRDNGMSGHKSSFVLLYTQPASSSKMATRTRVQTLPLAPFTLSLSLHPPKTLQIRFVVWFLVDHNERGTGGICRSALVRPLVVFLASLKQMSHDERFPEAG